jgi:hypothetical protein
MSGCHSHLWGGSLEGRLDRPPRSHEWARAKDARRAVGELFPPNSRSIPHLTPYRRLISAALFARAVPRQPTSHRPMQPAPPPPHPPCSPAPPGWERPSPAASFSDPPARAPSPSTAPPQGAAPPSSRRALRVRSSCPSMSALSESYYPAHSRSGGQRVPDTDHAGRGGPTQRAPGFQADPYEPASGVRGWQGEAADERGGEGGLGDLAREGR